MISWKLNVVESFISMIEFCHEFDLEYIEIGLLISEKVNRVIYFRKKKL